MAGPWEGHGGSRSDDRGLGSHHGVWRTTGSTLSEDSSDPIELLGSASAPEPLVDSTGFLLPPMGGGGPPPPPPPTGFLLPHMGGGGPPPPPLSAGFLLPHMGGGGPPPPPLSSAGFLLLHIGGGGPLPPLDSPRGDWRFDHIGGGGLPAVGSVLGSSCMGDSGLSLPSPWLGSRTAAGEPEAGEPDALVGRLPPLANNLEPKAFMA